MIVLQNQNLERDKDGEMSRLTPSRLIARDVKSTNCSWSEQFGVSLPTCGFTLWLKFSLTDRTNCYNRIYKLNW